MAMFINRYKVIASGIADDVARGDIGIAVNRTLDGRRTKGARAALLAGLVVGALCDRKEADAAARFLNILAQHIDR